MRNKILGFFSAHKASGILAVLAFGAAGYLLIAKASVKKTETRYILAAATKETIVTTVSGSGQVSAATQVDLKSKSSGTLVTYRAAVGQEVKAGQVIAQLDATSAVKAVRDARNSLQAAQIALQKLQQPNDALSLLQAENALTSAQDAKTSDQNDLARAYDDGSSAVVSAFLELPGIMADLDSLLYGSAFNGSQSNIDGYAGAADRYDHRAASYHDDAVSKYANARAAYDASLNAYKGFNRTTAAPADVEALVSGTHDTARHIADAIKAADDLVQFYRDQSTLHGAVPLPISATHVSTLNADTVKINAQMNTLLTVVRTIQNGKSALIVDDRSIAERQASLEKLKAGTDPLDVKSSELSLRMRQDALYDAQSALDDYSVRAPFDGVIAAAPAKKGDQVSNGTTLATLITANRIAQLSLNEVDVAKIAVGQKATLTFDVLSDLSITGNVIEIDALGTTSQGVVSYGVKIAFDTDDDRIKPGMTVSASIVTAVKTDALSVPNAAVKSSGDGSYVETVIGATAADAQDASGILAPSGTSRITVQTGLASDTRTEILSGLKEGDLVVSRAVTSSVSATSAGSANRSILQATGAGGTRTPGGGFPGR